MHGDGQLGSFEVSTWSRVVTGRAGVSNPARYAGQPQTPVVARVYGALKSRLVSAGAFSRLHDRVAFDDRRTGAAVLVGMLAGYKPDLWRFVMPRFRAALPEADVCIISPGLRHEGLANLCRREGWSYLSTATNDVALAQNICYRLHDGAKMIVKLDEDMFLLPDTITALLAAYRDIKADGVVDPGFVAPMIPLNGFCYRHLLEMLGLLDAYEAAFGRARLATSGLAVHTDPAAARWIWERTAPLAVTAARLDALPRRVLLCPIQFSIGLIAFERRFWEQIGYLAVHRRRLLAAESARLAATRRICARGRWKRHAPLSSRRRPWPAISPLGRNMPA